MYNIKIPLTKLIVTFIVMVFLNLDSSLVFAQTPISTSFPTCPGPFGQTIASFPDGLHAIAGDSKLHEGSDNVFQIDNTHSVQCFCPVTDTTGTQTNWLPADNMSEQDKQSLLNQGWIFVANGSSWGLSPIPYLALNLNFSCVSISLTPTLTPNLTPIPTPTIESVNPNSTPPVGGNQPGGPSGPCTDQKPPTPTLLSVTNSTPNSVLLNWTSVSPATDYTISYGITSKNHLFGVFSTGKVTNFTIGALNPSSPYCFTVKALNSCQPGEYSNEICINQSAQQILPASTGQGEVLGISTLANTASSGTDFIINLSIFTGIISLLYGLALRTTKKTMLNFKNRLISGGFIFTGIGLIITIAYFSFLPNVMTLPLYASDNKTQEVVIPKKDIFPTAISVNGKLPIKKIVVGEYNGGQWQIGQNNAYYLSTSSQPEQLGNMVIYGHDSEVVFGRLKLLKEGDIININTSTGDELKYKITSISNVSPKDTNILKQTEDQTLTVFTCSGFLDSTRLVIVGKKFS